MSGPNPVTLRIIRKADPRAEYLAAGAAILATFTAGLLLLPDVRGLLGGGLALLMIMIAVVDGRSYIIPDALTLATLILGLAHAVVTAPDAITSQLVAVLLRGAVFAVGFLVLRIGYRWLRRREGIGLGDVKLAGAGGVWIGWMMIPVVIEIAAATALTFYLACYLRRRGDDHGHSVHLGDRLP